MTALQIAPQTISQRLEQTNFQHLVIEIIWFGLAFPAMDRFREVYAIRLGADATQLTWLASLPALVLLLSSSLAGRWMSRYSDPLQAIFWPGIGFRMAFLLPALTAFLPAHLQIPWLFLAIALPGIAHGICAVGFIVMFRESVHEKTIAPLHSRRLMALNITVSISGLLVGLWLEKVPFPFNYQIMFAAAFIFSLVSWWHVNKVRALPELVARSTTRSTQPVNPWKSPSFQAVAVVAALSFITFTAIKPLIVLHLIRNLGTSEWFISNFGLADLAAGALVALFVRQIVERIGNRSMIGIGLAGTGLSALLIATTHNLNITLLASAIGGASWMLVSVGQFAYFSEMTPMEHKQSYTTAYHQVVFLSMFIGPLIGRLLSSDSMPIVSVLLVGALLRLLAGVLIQTHPRQLMLRAFHIAFSAR
jgi:MFS family permease